MLERGSINQPSTRRVYRRMRKPRAPLERLGPLLDASSTKGNTWDTGK